MTRIAAGSSSGRLTVVIAPDSFKGSLSAAEVATAIAAGWRELRPDDTIVLLPQADGGEGTLDAIAAAVPDAVRRSAGMVTGPDGRPTPGEWLELPGHVGVVELAAVSGLPLMAELDPMGAQTIGVGEVIASALDAGAASLVLGLGGSASTDGGAGALGALGLDLRDGDGALLPPGGGSISRLAAIDRSRLRPAPAGGVTLLTDVDAPLLGARGAAAVFGPQKGATADQVSELDAALAHFATTLATVFWAIAHSSTACSRAIPQRQGRAQRAVPATGSPPCGTRAWSEAPTRSPCSADSRNTWRQLRC